MRLGVDQAWAYLNIQNPLCAWNTYRGALISPLSEQGFVSVWFASALAAEKPGKVTNELLLETCREELFPDRVSRLRGLYCFPTVVAADRAAHAWGGHFRADNLVELDLTLAAPKRDRLDSNWLTYAPCNDMGVFEDYCWMKSYWAGDPFPDKEPIWEILVEGRMIVLGTSIRERAYQLMKRHLPSSLGILEIARQAEWIESDLGNVCSFLRVSGDIAHLEFYMNWKDADNRDFIARLEALHAGGHPINHDDLAPHLFKGEFGQLPDLRPFGFSRSVNALAMLDLRHDSQHVKLRALEG
jgi:hypothetical protein